MAPPSLAYGCPPMRMISRSALTDRRSGCPRSPADDFPLCPHRRRSGCPRLPADDFPRPGSRRRGQDRRGSAGNHHPHPVPFPSFLRSRNPSPPFYPPLSQLRNPPNPPYPSPPPHKPNQKPNHHNPMSRRRRETHPPYAPLIGGPPSPSDPDTSFGYTSFRTG